MASVVIEFDQVTLFPELAEFIKELPSGLRIIVGLGGKRFWIDDVVQIVNPLLDNLLVVLVRAQVQLVLAGILMGEIAGLAYVSSGTVMNCRN